MRANIPRDDLLEYADGALHQRDFARHGALSNGHSGWWDHQVAGCAAPTLMTSRSAVSFLPLVSGPSSTEITTRTRKSIVLIIIGMAKPKFICTARYVSTGAIKPPQIAP